MIFSEPGFSFKRNQDVMDPKVSSQIIFVLAKLVTLSNRTLIEFMTVLPFTVSCRSKKNTHWRVKKKVQAVTSRHG